MMKRNFLAFFISIAVTALCYAEPSAVSKTSLANSQAPFSSVSSEMVAGFRPDRTYTHQIGKRGAFQAVLFGGRSTHADNLTRYFFPHGKTMLSVAEDDLLDNFAKKKDLLAQNFNIFTKNGNFRSEISLAPKQSTVGLGVHWRQCFLRNPFTGDGVWVSASTPLVCVINRVNLQENILNNGGGPDLNANNVVVANMQQAFNQSDWNFGKIIDSSMKKTRLADIELKVGYDKWLEDQLSHLELYGGLIVPTSNKNKGEYLFEPIVGRGGHVGIMAGGSYGKDLWINYYEDMYVQWELAVHGEYLFKNKQTRSFDLVDKPWSRYLPLYANVQQAQEAQALPDRTKGSNLSTPGINILTQRVTVTPGFSCDMNSAFVFTRDTLKGELGYNFFFKRAESVKLACPWQPGPAIKYTSGVGQTNPIRDITGNKYLEQEVL